MRQLAVHCTAQWEWDWVLMANSTPADAEAPRLMDQQYTVVIEKTPLNFSAYVPDLPGCIATASTRKEVVHEIQQAVEFHIEDLREQGEPVPEPQSTATVVSVAERQRPRMSP